MTPEQRSTIMTRREAMAAGTLAAAALLGTGLTASATAQTKEKVVANGRIKQSACKWCYGKIPLKEFCRSAKEMEIGRAHV